MAVRTRARAPQPRSCPVALRRTRRRLRRAVSSCWAAIRPSSVHAGPPGAKPERVALMTGDQTGQCSGVFPQAHGRSARIPRSHNQRSSPMLANPSISPRTLPSTVVPLRPGPTTDSTLTGATEPLTDHLARAESDSYQVTAAVGWIVPCPDRALRRFALARSSPANARWDAAASLSTGRRLRPGSHRPGHVCGDKSEVAYRGGKSCRV